MSKSGAITYRPMESSEWLRVAELIHNSTNSWYLANGKNAIFQGPSADALLFCEVYEDLDPGCCLIAVCEDSGKIAGSCFYHPRDTHMSLGIMNVNPDFFSRGIARNLLTRIIDLAEKDSLPVRLVSSAQNLDSYSLYTRQGFSPIQAFQDMYLEVPKNGLGLKNATPFTIDDATEADIQDMVNLENELVGINREKDFRYFIENERRIWQTVVCRDPNKMIVGFLSSVNHPASKMIGPGVARNEEVIEIMLANLLDRFRGESPVFLLPVSATRSVQSAYTWGARNCEIHFAQCRGESMEPDGIIMPTFMPETG